MPHEFLAEPFQRLKTECKSAHISERCVSEGLVPRVGPYCRCPDDNLFLRSQGVFASVQTSTHGGHLKLRAHRCLSSLGNSEFPVQPDQHLKSPSIHRSTLYSRHQ